MSLTVDEALAALRAIASQLDALPPDDPQRGPLVARRDELRAAARTAADTARSDEALRRELEHLRIRLAALDGEKIKPGLMEHRSWINDPSAYSRVINDSLDEENRLDRESIEERIGELEALVEPQDLAGDASEPSSRSASNE